ncbi:MAG: putative glycolipid-binding domain-containing protein [Nitrososphaeraceae archaeon]
MKKTLPFNLHWTCEPSWKVKTLNLELVGTKEKIKLESDGHGNWSNDSGIITKLHGAIGIDISATPFTNTLPIRRLKLRKKQSAEILVVYLTIPELSIDIDQQRYTCLSKNTYLFGQTNRNFAREIEVDKNGLVVTYPGLFKRL